MASKEIRSLITVGGSIVVSLPITWLNYHDAKAGDKVEVVTKEDVAEIRLLKKENE